jgi:hypothetical protein
VRHPGSAGDELRLSYNRSSPTGTKIIDKRILNTPAPLDNHQTLVEVQGKED